MTMSELAQQIIDYLQRDIAERGGTARRLSRIQLEIGSYPDDDTMAAAIDELVAAGAITLEEIAGLGFIYAKPTS